jgi:hypothetical protein
MGDAQTILEQIRQRLDAGAHGWAIEQLHSLIAQGAKGPDLRRLLALALLKTGAFDAAIAELKAARAEGTSAATELAFGRFLNRERHKEAALDCFLSAIALEPENEDALALICMHHADRGAPALAIPYGQRSLDARDRQADVAAEPVKAARPNPFDPSSPQKNVIAFSLFGDNPYYWECAVANASMAYAIFPEWRCRFYCDRQVPETIRRQLLRMRSQIFLSPRQSESWSGLFWRFQAFDDPEVNVVMVRDVDSPFTLRERLAVDEWLKSEFPFHVIRDHPYHCEPMMAGLWSGWTGLLPSMAILTEAHRHEQDSRYADQKFLRRHIWPRIRGATLAHDRCFTLGETRKPPEHSTELLTHIGMGWPKRRRTPGSETTNPA